MLVSSACPIFVVALAGTAFANGLWMCTGGFLVHVDQLNVFWRYVFSYIDYQSYVFRGMMINEFNQRRYDCGLPTANGCQCMYAAEILDGRCSIDGKDILKMYGYDTVSLGSKVAIMFGIIVGYRLLGYLVLYVRRT